MDEIQRMAAAGMKDIEDDDDEDDEGDESELLVCLQDALLVVVFLYPSLYFAAGKSSLVLVCKMFEWSVLKFERTLKMFVCFFIFLFCSKRYTKSRKQVKKI